MLKIIILGDFILLDNHLLLFLIAVDPAAGGTQDLGLFLDLGCGESSWRAKLLHNFVAHILIEEKILLFFVFNGLDHLEDFIVLILKHYLQVRGYLLLYRLILDIEELQLLGLLSQLHYFVFFLIAYRYFFNFLRFFWWVQSYIANFMDTFRGMRFSRHQWLGRLRFWCSEFGLQRGNWCLTLGLTLLLAMRLGLSLAVPLALPLAKPTTMVLTLSL